MDNMTNPVYGMDSGEFRECIRRVQRYVEGLEHSLEKKREISENGQAKILRLEEELKAYRKEKDRLEKIVESNQETLSRYEKDIKGLKKELESRKGIEDMWRKAYLEALNHVRSNNKNKKVDNKKFSGTVKEDEKQVDKNTKEERVTGEFRVHKDKNGVLHRYEKVEEKNQNGIVLVRWELVD